MSRRDPPEPIPPQWQSAADQAAYLRARKRVRAIRGFYRHLAVFVLFNGGMLAWQWLGTPRRPWFGWPIAGWSIGLLAHGLSVWAPQYWLGRDWEERKIAELMGREQIRSLSTEKQLVEARLRLLQAQIEPHFLFNTLANVISLIETAPPRARVMLEHFVAYLRASLAASRATRGTVGQEAELLRNYLELIRIRMGNRLTYDIAVAPDVADAPLAPMLLQPLVENAIKHGLEPKVEGGKVTVNIRRQASQLLATVEDNGLGFNPQGSSGVGLDNLRERLKVLYDGGAQVNIEDRAPGTAITLVLPATDHHSSPDPTRSSPP